MNQPSQVSQPARQAAAAKTITRNLTMKLAPGQFSDQRWASGIRNFSFVKLGPGDRLVIKLLFQGGSGIQVSDTGFFGNDETIYFKLAPPDPLIFGPFEFEYEWFFLGTGGALDTNPVIGTGRVLRNDNKGLINAGDQPEEVELTNSSFTFTGIELRVTAPANLPQNRWEMSRVELEVGGDSVR